MTKTKLAGFVLLVLSMAPLSAQATDEIVVQAARPTNGTLRFTSPIIPKIIQEQPKEAWIHLRLAITASGDVTHVELVQSYPHTVFDRTVLDVAKAWKFIPQLQDGVAVPAPAYDLAVSIYNDDWETYRKAFGRNGSTRGINAYNFGPFLKILRVLRESNPDDPAITADFFQQLQKRLDAEELNVSEIARYFAFRTRFNRMNGRYDDALGDARRALLLAEFFDNGKLVLGMHLEILTSLINLGRNDDAVDYYDSWRRSSTAALIPPGLIPEMESLREGAAGKGRTFTIVDFDETHKRQHRPQIGEDHGSIGIDLHPIDMVLPEPAHDTPEKWVPLPAKPRGR